MLRRVLSPAAESALLHESAESEYARPYGQGVRTRLLISGPNRLKRCTSHDKTLLCARCKKPKYCSTYLSSFAVQFRTTDTGVIAVFSWVLMRNFCPSLVTS